MRGYAWKFDRSTHVHVNQQQLQWSHAWLRMEIIGTNFIWFRGVVASMEPCVVTHGNVIIVMFSILFLFASMEPCVVTHGNQAMIRFNAAEQTASMEPCVVTHGNATWHWQGIGASHRFNGAMRGYAWKLLKRQSSAFASGASMEPCVVTHGNHKRDMGICSR